jgi:hypothetical protein
MRSICLLSMVVACAVVVVATCAVWVVTRPIPHAADFQLHLAEREPPGRRQNVALIPGAEPGASTRTT